MEQNHLFGWLPDSTEQERDNLIIEIEQIWLEARWDESLPETAVYNQSVLYIGDCKICLGPMFEGQALYNSHLNEEKTC
jgi:hypothetical protein